MLQGGWSKTSQGKTRVPSAMPRIKEHVFVLFVASSGIVREIIAKVEISMKI